MKNLISDLNIGVDFLEISDFRKIHNNKSFFRKFFTTKEMNYCHKKSDPIYHLATRFAAKEAVIKCFAPLKSKLKYHEIEILKTEEEYPKVNILKKNFLGYNIKVSMTNTKNYVAAVAIAIEYEK